MLTIVLCAMTMPHAVVTPPDVNMQATYARLAQRASDAARQSKMPHWVAIAGGPGAGKSTLAGAVASICQENHGVSAVVLPMDGFHFSKSELAGLDPPDASQYLPRRGAPWTFDAERCFNELSQAKQHSHGTLPRYDRVLSDPVPDGVRLDPSHQLVFVEGNYLLLGALALSFDEIGLVKGIRNEDDGVPQPPLDEINRWKPLLDLFDESWFITPLAGIAEQRRRLIARHLETWTDAKTKMFGASSPEEGAARRTDANDLRNAFLVDRCRDFADLVVGSS